MVGDTVRVESGDLAGIRSEDGVWSFKGVPYARPPVGALRWRPPEAPERWTGVRSAAEFGPRCVQPNRPDHAIGYFGPEPESEDCLYLNIWTAAPSRDEKRPVMVWIHGGGFLVGSGSLPIFDGAALARRGAVVVTMNYRLGRLGFFAHPELSAEQPYRTSGNYGLLDQIAALRWVKANIAGFGGDPDRVTIFGQSAGSSSVSTLMVSPLARGLFQRAIGQSGGAFFARIQTRLDVAEQAGATFGKQLGAATVDELRARPVREIQFQRPEEGNILKDIYDSADGKGIDRKTAWSIVDGHVIPDKVMELYAAGAQNDVPLITGATSDEGSTQPAISTLAEFQRRAHADWGEMADQYLRTFAAQSDADADRSSRRAIGTRIFNWENWIWANLQTKTGRQPVYHYHFGQAPPKPPFPGRGGDLERDIGAFHTADIPYVFQTLDVRAWPWTAADRELADTIARYWLNFAATGNPNGTGLPHWPRFEPGSNTTLIFQNGANVGAVPDPDALAFWTELDRHLRGVPASA